MYVTHLMVSLHAVWTIWILMNFVSRSWVKAMEKSRQECPSPPSERASSRSPQSLTNGGNGAGVSIFTFEDMAACGETGKGMSDTLGRGR